MQTDLAKRPLDVVAACRRADFRILQKTLTALRECISFRKLYVITARKNMSVLQRNFPAHVQFLDEDELIPGMMLENLRQLKLPGFPSGAGWYFQQLLKYAFAFQKPQDDYYLIWDADTVPLRTLRFFDDEGRMLFTLGKECHGLYLPTYRNLLRENPNPEISFIAQHMIMQKSLVREMLARIEANFPEKESWAWKIMHHLVGTGDNLFSEYEMMGNFVANNYLERVAFRKLEWLREGALKSRGVPSDKHLKKLGQKYYFAAFESRQMPMRRVVHYIRAKLRTK